MGGVFIYKKLGGEYKSRICPLNSTEALRLRSAIFFAQKGYGV